MKEVKTLYSIDETVLIPAVKSFVDSRDKCYPYYHHFGRRKLPLYIAPMSCLVNEDNYGMLDELGFNVILPRTVSWLEREYALRHGQWDHKWVAVGLDEGESLLSEEDPNTYYKARVCIDIANGHQERSYDLCRNLRLKFPSMEIMVGNIANPESYWEYAKVGADYVRVGIGSGHVCTTSVQTGIHYPMASLISECYELKQKLKELKGDFYPECEIRIPKIIADGGFGYIDQIVKALALGADYVMLGKIAASFPEACGEILNTVGGPRREYYGMSTEKAQRLMHPDPNYVPKHTEGTVRYLEIRSSTEEWIGDFIHALKSSMSYSDALNLTDYIGKVEWGIQNPTTFNAYIKS